MDPQTDFPALIEDLEVNIDELTTSLTPLLPPHTLSKTATTLPLLEKAKLHILAAYAIESVLFSALQAGGHDAKAHALFAELSRLKAYFSKIKDAEAFATKAAEKENRTRLDVGAAQRFIKHGLSGNERYDELRKERMAKEKERALEKARALTNKTFSDDEGEAATKKRGAEDVQGVEGTPGKKMKLDGEAQDDEGNTDTPAPAPTKRGRKAKKTVPADGHDEHESHAATTHDAQLDAAHSPDAMPVDVESPAPAKKKRGRPSKKDKAASTSTPHKADDSTPARATRSSAPKTPSEAFDALAAGSPAAGKAKGKGKGKGKAK